MSKICKECKKELEYSLFSPSKVIKDGFENKCKSCRAEARKVYINNCEDCETDYKTAYKKSLYCSAKCRPQNKKDRVTVNCFICSKTKDTVLSRIKDYKHFYCSDECKNEGYSKLYSGENSIHYNTVKFNCSLCGLETSRWVSQVEKHKVSYCSNECKNRDFVTRFSGENNPNYDNLKSDEDRITNRNIEGYPEWRRKVFERDNYSCMCCGDNRGGNLVAHHLLNYTEHPELRTELSNGSTLCEVCHKAYHDFYGYTKNNADQYREYIASYATKKGGHSPMSAFLIPNFKYANQQRSVSETVRTFRD